MRLIPVPVESLLIDAIRTLAMPQSRAPRLRKPFMVVLALLAATPCLAAADPPVVGFYRLEAQPHTVSTTLPGRVVAYRMAKIRPQVDGIIRRRLFKAGAQVEAGQILYQIDASPYRAAVAEAKAAVAQARARLKAARPAAERARQLNEVNAISEAKLNQALAELAAAEAQLASAKAKLKAAQVDLSNTTIEAPIAGRVGTTSFTVGALVAAYQDNALTTVRQIDPVYVDIQLSQSQYADYRQALASGQLEPPPKDKPRVYVTVGDSAGQPLPGKLIFTSAAVDPDTGSVNLRAVVDNPDKVLLPGMFVRVKLIIGTDPNAILIPQQAVQRDNTGQPYTFVVTGKGIAQRRELQIAGAVGNRWRVTGGLQPGARVIVQGIGKVTDGQAVDAVAVAPDASGTFLPVDPTAESAG